MKFVLCGSLTLALTLAAAGTAPAQRTLYPWTGVTGRSPHVPYHLPSLHYHPPGLRYYPGWTLDHGDHLHDVPGYFGYTPGYLHYRPGHFHFPNGGAPRHGHHR